MKHTCLFFLMFILLISISSIVEAQAYKPRGKINGKGKPSRGQGSEKIYGPDSCKPGITHTKCSPPVSKNTNATLTLNSFQKGGDGGGPSECDGHYHSDDTLVVALSTGWFNNMKRCFKFIKIHGNGRNAKAMVVDECDSTRGCLNNIVDASKAVWKALGVHPNDNKWGLMDITWSDA